MDILYLLVPLSVVLVLLIAGVLWYAVRSGQFDDLDSPGFKVLLDDDTPRAGGAGERGPSDDATGTRDGER
ncbi:MAG: cbb3-type cytochrome oxidase assembly protein CcoS [Burkholderiales bacterium]|nr:cbb3-type cytochrome oxidase assembly protein CcoS [Burkholderiales bacterium]